MKESSVLHIGFDDTDSRKGMCTTFLAYKIVEYLKKEKVKFLDYPYLIRFNPNVPWKTRGNGAVALKIKTEKPQLVKKNIVKYIKKYSAIKDGANPGLVFYEHREIPENFSKFGQMALHRLVSRNEAKKFVKLMIKRENSPMSEIDKKLYANVEKHRAYFESFLN